MDYPADSTAKQCQGGKGRYVVVVVVVVVS